jgi:hypothetical protein
MSHRPIPSIALCLLASNLLVAGQVRTPENRDWDWLSDHRSEAFERLLPVEHDGAYVAYRQYRDLYQDVPEQYFMIRVTDSTGALEATVAKPVGASIQQQLLDMHMADRLASFNSLVSRIKLQRHQLTSTTCGALQPRLEALSKVAISIPARDTIVLHPLVHRIVLDLLGGRIDASLYEDEQPLVQWARTTFDALSRCATDRR